MMGTVGGMFSGPPFAFLINNFGWRQATIIAAYIGIGLAFLCWIIIKDRRQGSLSNNNKNPQSHFLVDLLYIARQPRLWIYAIFGGLTYVPISAFCELWAVPFLMKKYGITNDIASFASVMLYLGIAIGSPIAAQISDRLNNRVSVMSLSALFTTVIFLSILYIPNLPLNFMFGMLFIAGAFNGGQILSFACVKDAVPNRLSGTAMGFTNAVVMMSGIIFQPLLGILLDFSWDGTLAADGTRAYTIDSYHVAILAVPACLCLSWILLRFARHQPTSPVS